MKPASSSRFGLRPGEAGLVLPLSFLLLANSMALAVSNVVSVSGFLSAVGVNELLIVWIVDMVLVLLATGAQSLIVDRFDRVTLLRGMALIFAACYAGLRLMFALGVPDWANYALLFLLTEQQWLFFPLIFWILANDLLDMSQAKRLFPRIASGNFYGQIVGLGIAAAAPAVLAALGVANSELLTMNVLIYLLIFVVVTLRFRGVTASPRPRQRETIRQALTEGWDFVRNVPAFRFLMFSMVIMSVAFTIVEFHFLKVTSEDTTFSDPDAFQTFFSLYNLGAILLSITIQTLLTTRVINGIGLKNTFLVYPLTLLAGLGFILALPTNLFAVVGGLLLPRLGNRTVDESARKSFQGLVPEERRGRVSMFMDSYLFAVGAIIGSMIVGGIILAGAALDLGPVYAMYLPLALMTGIIAAWYAYRLRAAYDASLLNWRLRRRKRTSDVLDKLGF